jgi:hypothetical protein
MCGLFCIYLYKFVDMDTEMCDHVFAVGGSGLNQGEKDESSIDPRVLRPQGSGSNYP